MSGEWAVHVNLGRVIVLDDQGRIDDIDRLAPDEVRQLFTVIKALADKLLNKPRTIEVTRDRFVPVKTTDEAKAEAKKKAQELADAFQRLLIDVSAEQKKLEEKK